VITEDYKRNCGLEFVFGDFFEETNSLHKRVALLSRKVYPHRLLTMAKSSYLGGPEETCMQLLVLFLFVSFCLSWEREHKVILFIAFSLYTSLFCHKEFIQGEYKHKNFLFK